MKKNTFRKKWEEYPIRVVFAAITTACALTATVSIWVTKERLNVAADGRINILEAEKRHLRESLRIFNEVKPDANWRWTKTPDYYSGH